MRIRAASLLLYYVLLSIDAEEQLLKLAPHSEEATSEEFPYQVSIRLNGRHLCGGSLISTTHVLTAAHCIHDLIQDPLLLRRSRIRVEVGSADRGHGKKYLVKRLSEHSNFSGKTTEYVTPYDIGVITLKEPVEISTRTKPIDLPEASLELANGTEVVVSGFGNAEKGGLMSPILKKSVMEIVSQEECDLVYRQRMKKGIKSSQICAKLEEDAGTCEGDSGGPLAYKYRHKIVVVGVVSAGVAKCGDGTPDTYTKVSSFLSYIMYEMNYGHGNESADNGKESRAVDIESLTFTSPYMQRLEKVNKDGHVIRDGVDFTQEMKNDSLSKESRTDFRNSSLHVTGNPLSQGPQKVNVGDSLTQDDANYARELDNNSIIEESRAVNFVSSTSQTTKEPQFSESREVNILDLPIESYLNLARDVISNSDTINTIS